MSTPPRRSRLRSILVTCLWFTPALVALAAGPREVDTCALDPQGNLTFGEPNGFCEVPTQATWRWALTIAVVTAIVLYARRRRRTPGAAGG